MENPKIHRILESSSTYNMPRWPLKFMHPKETVIWRMAVEQFLETSDWAPSIPLSHILKEIEPKKMSRLLAALCPFFFFSLILLHAVSVQRHFLQHKGKICINPKNSSRRFCLATGSKFGDPVRGGGEI